VHPGFFNLFKNLERQKQGQTDAFIGPKACRTYAANALKTLERRIAEER
jgi:hypothetical protein